MLHTIVRCSQEEGRLADCVSSRILRTKPQRRASWGTGALLSERNKVLKLFCLYVMRSHSASAHLSVLSQFNIDGVMKHCFCYENKGGKGKTSYVVVCE